MTDSAQPITVKKGLDGVIVDSTAVSHVMPEISALLYRGYLVDELAEHCSFEEIAYLLLCGELPTAVQLGDFVRRERAQRRLSANLLEIIKLFPKQSHPMDALRTAVSYLAMEDPQPRKIDRASYEAKGIQLLAKIPIIIAANFRCRKNESIVPPDPGLSIAENF